MRDYVEVRFAEPRRLWVTQEVENEAAALFAQLISAAPTDVAAVPSTMTGENLVCAALGIGPKAGVVTDAFHYFGSLAKYGELRKAGVPVAIVPPRGDRILPEDIAAAITPATRLVALSLVSSHTGFVHDLKQVCDLAHRRGVLVYADIIQAAGALPIDVRDSGVDFACCGGYKWLQGDFGVAFLYVSPAALPRLKRVHRDRRREAGRSPRPRRRGCSKSPHPATRRYGACAPRSGACWISVST
jgi:selenocysteine lyase/cysteine desulfurase